MDGFKLGSRFLGLRKKFYAWEIYFKNVIEGLRKEEFKQLSSISLLVMAGGAMSLFSSKMAYLQDLASLIMLVQMLKPHTHQYSLQKFFHQTLFTFFNDYVKSEGCILINTKILYAHLFKTAILQSNTFIVDSLMDWCCKSNSMVHAPNCLIKLLTQMLFPGIF